jgi:hypothetical protein
VKRYAAEGCESSFFEADSPAILSLVCGWYARRERTRNTNCFGVDSKATTGTSNAIPATKVGDSIPNRDYFAGAAVSEG